jgi:beta-glucanase (GH16 family)
MSRLALPRLRQTAKFMVVVLFAGIAGPHYTLEHSELRHDLSDLIAVDPSGIGMPAGPRHGWDLVFADDFRKDVPTGQFPAAVADKWRAYDDGWRDTSKNGTYHPSKVVSIHGGVMDLHLRTEHGTHLVAAPLPKTLGPGSEGGYLYGRYAVRFRSDRIPGYKVAWLLWPDSDKWSDGEIDFPEGNLDTTISAFMHHRGTPEQQDVYRSGAAFDAWHTAVIEWTPPSVRFILDGTVIGESRDRDMLPAKPMHWVLQTETNLDGHRPEALSSGHVLIDWIVAYRRLVEPPPHLSRAG